VDEILQLHGTALDISEKEGKYEVSFDLALEEETA